MATPPSRKTPKKTHFTEYITRYDKKTQKDDLRALITFITIYGIDTLLNSIS
jgi:hypothetical protein